MSKELRMPLVLIAIIIFLSAIMLFYFVANKEEFGVNKKPVIESQFKREDHLDWMNYLLPKNYSMNKTVLETANYEHVQFGGEILVIPLLNRLRIEEAGMGSQFESPSRTKMNAKWLMTLSSQYDAVGVTKDLFRIGVVDIEGKSAIEGQSAISTLIANEQRLLKERDQEFVRIEALNGFVGSAYYFSDDAIEASEGVKVPNGYKKLRAIAFVNINGVQFVLQYVSIRDRMSYKREKSYFTLYLKKVVELSNK